MATLIPFTSKQQIQNRLSAVGTGLRVDHDPNNALNEAIDAATADVGLYLNVRYPDATLLAANAWVQSVTTNRACIYVCSWRNNGVPKFLTDLWAEQEKRLTEIQMGKMLLSGIPIGTSHLPQAVHTTINYGYTRSQRYTYQGSTIRPGGVPIRVDYTEPGAGGVFCGGWG